jgi:hypothetical protein
MRKLLFGTTALIAAGLLANGAQAADPITIGLGGYFHAGASIASQDMDQDKRSFGLDREAEIFFTGSTTLDTGLSVGVNVQLEAETSGDQIDESFMWIDGAFGQLRAGSFDGAMNVMGVYAPSAAQGLYGVVFPTGNSDIAGAGSVGEGGFGLGPDYDAAKIAWYSPTVGGVKFGVSFTPEGGGADDDANNSRGTAGMDVPASVGIVDGAPGVVAASVSAQQSEVFAVGGNWSGEFGGGSMSVGAGYAAASVEAGTAAHDDHEEWIIGARASMASFSFGGNYSEDNRGMDGNNDRTTLALGVTYSGMGPMTYGLTYAFTSRERDGDSSLDSSGVSLAANWALGSGLTVYGEIQFWDIELAGGGNEATAGLIGTTVRF